MAQFEIVGAQGHPGHGTTCLDGLQAIGIPDGPLAGGKAAVVVPVRARDAPPYVFQRRVILRSAGGPVQLRQRHDAVQRLPAFLFHSVKVLAGQRILEPVAAAFLGPLGHHAFRRGQIRLTPRLPV